MLKLFYHFVFPALSLLMKQAARPNSPLRGHERTVQYLQHLGKMSSYLLDLIELIKYYQSLHICIFSFRQ